MRASERKTYNAKNERKKWKKKANVIKKLFYTEQMTPSKFTTNKSFSKMMKSNNNEIGYKKSVKFNKINCMFFVCVCIVYVIHKRFTIYANVVSFRWFTFASSLSFVVIAPCLSRPYELINIYLKYILTMYKRKTKSGYKILVHVGDNTKRLRCINDENERDRYKQ